MNLEFLKFIFSGIGGDILFFILGIVCGVGGSRIRNRHINKQKAGDNSIQINGNNNF